MPASSRRLQPGDTIGILGGGQLGRMLAMAAADLGLKAHIYSPDKDSPAFDVAAHFTIAEFEDESALARFAETVDVVTYEFENVPARTAEVLADRKPVRPGASALAASQDRLVEKEFLTSLGIKTAPYAAVDDAGALPRAVAQIGRPAILKTRRFGYDGKGQAMIRDGSDLGASFRSLGNSAMILEGVVNFTKEVSVIAARGIDGSFAAYDVCENVHANHILSTSLAPARISEDCAAEAVVCARKIADALDYVGVIAVEMFVVDEPRVGAPPQQTIRVNEIAPRVHNSGHWTLDGAVTSQFEQHVRAIAGWPLGATTRNGAAVEMRNLIGEDVNDWAKILAEPGACLRLYGKAEARPGRKMGHVVRILPRAPKP
jgi:5-(carboxyamino)imidazole ribonucleotide synthase